MQSTKPIPKGQIEDFISNTTQAYVDNKIVQTITNGDITHSPSGDVVFDTFATKLTTALGTNGLPESGTNLYFTIARAISALTGQANTLFANAANYIVGNATIVGATKTKITYDAKGLVISGADATTADIADSTNRRYVTDSQLTSINNNTGDNATNTQYSGLATSKEDTVNKVTTMTGNTVSNIVFLTAKAIYDWATGLFVPKTRTITINGTTQDLTTDRTFTIASTTDLFKDIWVVRKQFSREYRRDGSTTFDGTTQGPVAMFQQGTASHVVLDMPSKGYFSGVGVLSAATANAISGWRNGYGSFTGIKWDSPFKYSLTFMFCDPASVANAFFSAGFFGGTGAFSAGGVTSEIYSLAIYHLAGDTNLKIRTSNGASTVVDLGVNFPCNTSLTDVYTVYFNWKVTSVDYYVLRHNTGHEATGTITTTLPTNISNPNEQVARGNGSTALSVKIAHSQAKVELYV